MNFVILLYVPQSAFSLASSSNNFFASSSFNFFFCSSSSFLVNAFVRNVFYLVSLKTDSLFDNSLNDYLLVSLSILSNSSYSYYSKN